MKMLLQFYYYIFDTTVFIYSLFILYITFTFCCRPSRTTRVSVFVFFSSNTNNPRSTSSYMTTHAPLPPQQVDEPPLPIVRASSCETTTLLES